MITPEALNRGLTRYLPYAPTLIRDVGSDGAANILAGTIESWIEAGMPDDPPGPSPLPATPTQPEPWRTIDQQVEQLEQIVHPEGRCSVCGGGKPYWKHTPSGESEYHPFTPSQPVPSGLDELREAAQAVLVELDIIRRHWNTTSKAMLVHRDTQEALRSALGGSNR